MKYKINKIYKEMVLNESFNKINQQKLANLVSTLISVQQELNKIDSAAANEIQKIMNILRSAMKKHKEAFQEGTWKLGKKRDIDKIVFEIKQLAKKAYNIVGDDEFMNSLGRAKQRAEELARQSKESSKEHIAEDLKMNYKINKLYETIIMDKKSLQEGRSTQVNWLQKTVNDLMGVRRQLKKEGHQNAANELKKAEDAFDKAIDMIAAN